MRLINCDGHRFSAAGTRPPVFVQRNRPFHLTPNPEDAYAARQHLAAILGGISALPDEQRMALILSVQQSLPNRDIAAAMGTSEGAVEQLLVRARRKLREIHRSVT